MGKGQGAIVPTRRSKTSLKKNGKRYEFYFVCEIGNDHILGYEDEDGNDVYAKVRELEKEGWRYRSC